MSVGVRDTYPNWHLKAYILGNELMYAFTIDALDYEHDTKPIMEVLYQVRERLCSIFNIS